jgi:hypothetical protein
MRWIMKITNTSAVRRRVEGVGYVNPGETVTVPEAVGLELRKLREFREERPRAKTAKKVAKTARAGSSAATSRAEATTADNAAEPATGGEEQ